MRNATRLAALALPATLVSLLVLAGARAQNRSTPEPRHFKPPRIAVLEVSRLFDGYNKKKDLETKLKAEIQEVEERRRETQGRLKLIGEELKNVQTGSARHRELTIQARGAEYDLKHMEEEILRKVHEKKLASLKELSLEISLDVDQFASSMEIDLVLEKSMLAEGTGGLALRWPIVHHAKPELDITDDLIARLNSRYGPPRVGVPGGEKTPRDEGR